MPPGGKHAVHDRLLSALERLEAKPTQAAAWEELQRLCHDLRPDNLPGLLHAAGSPSPSSTQFSRVHCARLAALCVTPGACPPATWHALLQPPLLPKLLALLARSLRDADAAVRAAAAEGLGVVAEQLAPAPGAPPTGVVGADHPVLGCILEVLAEPGAGAQAAAATALGIAADSLGPLDPALLRQVLRTASNPLFLGRAELWGAVARLEGGRVRGLVAGSFAGLLALWPELLGSAAEGAGLLGALVAKDRAFAARAAAAHALKALAVGVGPQAGGWEAAAAALKAAKTDVSKPVREAAAGALPVLTELLSFMGSGAPAQQWPAFCGAVLASEPGSKRQQLGGGPPAKAAAGKGALAGLEEDAPPGGYIVAVHPAVGAAGAAGVPSPGAGAPPPPVLPSGPVPSAPMAPGGPMAVPAAAHSPAAAASQEQLAGQLAAVLERQARLETAFAGFAASTQATLQGVQQCLAGLGADVAALAAGGGASGWAASAAAMQQRLAASMAAVAVGAQQAQQARVALGPEAGVPASELASPGGASPAACPKRLSSLHRCYDSLERQMRVPVAVPLPAAAAAASTPARPPAGVAAACTTGASPAAAQAAAAAAPSAASAGSQAAQPDWEATYACLLASPLAGDQQAQLRLLRALARSGPAWERLSPATGQRLMQAMAAMLREGGALKRLLPALWPLADTATPASQAAAAYPAATREGLLAALAAYPLPAPASAEAQQEGGGGEGAGAAWAAGCPQASSELGDKRDLLVSALRAVWG